MLAVEGISASYGGVRALDGVSLTIAKGEIVALLGANGAGKSTALRIVTGLLAPSRGTVAFEGRSVLGMRPERIVRLGISMVPEARELFLEMTVAENLELGRYIRNDSPAVKRDLDRVLVLFPRLAERLKQVAGTLSGGEQQMLAIARALMAHPTLLLLDEPSLGLAPAVIDEIAATIVEINRDGTTILLVEQNAQLALELSHRGYVLETGRVALAGPSSELAENAEMRRLYLGV